MVLELGFKYWGSGVECKFTSTLTGFGVREGSGAGTGSGVGEGSGAGTGSGVGGEGSRAGIWIWSGRRGILMYGLIRDFIVVGRLDINQAPDATIAQIISTASVEYQENVEPHFFLLSVAFCFLCVQKNWVGSVWCFETCWSSYPR